MNHLEIIQPKDNYSYVVENLNKICYNINVLKSRYRNDNDIIKTMAVTKTVAPQIVNIAVENGITLLGENKVQEFVSKKSFYYQCAEIHFIGHLQTNKVKYIINDVSMIESVDSFRLAKEIDKQAFKNNKTMDILIEVNIGDEETKNGVQYSNVKDIINEISMLDNIKVKGLMAIPPANAGEDMYFKLQQLFNEIRDMKISDTDISVLSVGMSNDYETAIKYGSNIIRIGTALFGKRI